MDRIVCTVRNCDQKLRIENYIIASGNLISTHGIHMVNDDLIKYVMSLKTKVATKISGYDVISNVFPLTGSIEILIKPSLTAKRSFTNRPIEV